MSTGAIILLVAVCAITVFEIASLIMTIVKRKKERKKASDEVAEDNNNKEVNAQ